jgi:hypothetical protein
MDEWIWWIGAAHIAFYATACSVVLIVAGTMKLHMWFKIMGRIIVWHHARYHSQRRHKDGLTDAEWAQGEPRP